MTISVELPREVEEQIVARATACGAPVGEVVREWLTRSAHQPLPLEYEVSAETLDALLDEAAGLVPDGTPTLTDAAMSRESIYTREDEW